MTSTRTVPFPPPCEGPGHPELCQDCAKMGFGLLSGFGLQSSDFRAAEHALPSTGRTLEQPCLRGALLGLEIGTSQGTLSIGAGRFGRAPHIVLSGAFLALRAPDCNGWLVMGLGTTARLGPRKNLPYSGVNSDPGGCYANPAQLNGSTVQVQASRARASFTQLMRLYCSLNFARVVG